MSLRLATMADVPALNALIAASARGLSTGFYTPTQIETPIENAFGVDTQLVADGTSTSAKGLQALRSRCHDAPPGGDGCLTGSHREDAHCPDCGPFAVLLKQMRTALVAGSRFGCVCSARVASGASARRPSSTF
jgi:hypothetical protein